MCLIVNLIIKFFWLYIVLYSPKHETHGTLFTFTIILYIFFTLYPCDNGSWRKVLTVSPRKKQSNKDKAVAEAAMIVHQPVAWHHHSYGTNILPCFLKQGLILVMVYMVAKASTPLLEHRETFRFLVPVQDHRSQALHEGQRVFPFSFFLLQMIPDMTTWEVFR